MARTEFNNAPVQSSASIGFEANLWLTAAKLRCLTVMNLVLRGIEADFSLKHADSFRRDLHPSLRLSQQLTHFAF
jgi:hypothetical protein